MIIAELRPATLLEHTDTETLKLAAANSFDILLLRAAVV